MAALKPGQPTQFKVQRRDDTMEANVTPGRRPKPKQQQNGQPVPGLPGR